MKEGKWATYQQVLKNPKIYNDANDACKRAVEAVSEATKDAILKRRNTGKKKHTNCWWTTECTAARKEKNVALTRWRHHRECNISIITHFNN